MKAEKFITLISWVLVIAIVVMMCLALSRPQVTHVESVRWTGSHYVYCGSLGGHVVCQESDNIKRIGDTIVFP